MNLNNTHSRVEVVWHLNLLAACLRRDLFVGLAADIDKIDDDLGLLKRQKGLLWVTYKLGPFESEIEFMPATGRFKYG